MKREVDRQPSWTNPRLIIVRRETFCHTLWYPSNTLERVIGTNRPLRYIADAWHCNRGGQMPFPDLVPRVSVTLMRRGTAVLGEREARLLDAVERVRSIKDAATAAGISYRTAWSAIQQMEQALGRPVVVSRAGGPGGGATTLTDDCRELLARYQNTRRELEECLMRGWDAPEALREAVR